jgi:two-component SAPR family response regulator
MAQPPSTPISQPAAGLHVLVLEDETLIALDLQDMLTAAGAAAVTIVRESEDLPRMLENGRPDIGILNVQPIPQLAGIAARVLTEAAIPFFFATGAAEPDIAREFPHVPIVSKPYSADAILEALAATLKGVQARD